MPPKTGMVYLPIQANSGLITPLSLNPQPQRYTFPHAANTAI